MQYQGPERRRHFVYVTRNTEYHLRDNRVVAVRDRSSKSFRPAHIAMHRELGGTVRLYSNGAVLPTSFAPRVGDPIYFLPRGEGAASHEVVTSRIERIDRPEKKIVASYPRA